MGKMSREKGKRGEREFAKFCRDQGFEVRRTAQYCGNTGEAADVVGLPHIHVEVKNTERLSIYDAMCQAIWDANKEGKGNLPIVAHKKNYHRWLVIMEAETFFEIYKESSYADEENETGAQAE